MRKILLLVLGAVICFSARGQISDQQLATQIGQWRMRGLTQQEMAVELLQSGATQEQVSRVRAQLSGGETASTPASAMAVVDEGSRLRTGVDSVTIANAADSMAAVRNGVVFGRDLFNNRRLTFEPPLNVATPDNYVLGPGDEVIIDIWGNSQQTIRQTVSPDGSIVANPVGLIRLNGLSVAQANERLRQAFGKVYALGNGTHLNLSLGQIRSIQVHVMGEAAIPGTYTVASLASLFHVLYSAGGVNDIGSLRDIRVHRGGRQVASVDVYPYLMEGRSDMDISLKDGDVVVVAPYRNLVAIAGKVKRPMKYELADGETLETLVRYAGGMTGDAYEKSVRVFRKSGREHRVYNVGTADFAGFPLDDCDSVAVEAVLERYSNRVEVNGAVFRPGVYALGGDVTTVRQLVEKAEGLRGDVFSGRAVLYRNRADYTPEALSIDIGRLMAGEVDDIALRQDDVLQVYSIFDLKEEYTVTISGDVGAPGRYAWVDNLTVEDLVVRAGGLLESASTVRVDVVQRIKNPESTTETREKAVHRSFTLKDGLVVKGGRGFVLDPFDAVYVRTSPGYSSQQNVLIDGQVMFGGEYALLTHGQRLSDLVEAAGGLTSEAYAQGARLMRQRSAEERARAESTLMLLRNSRDSVSVEDLYLIDCYPVGIQLDKALANPRSDYDMVLRQGDALHIPDYMGTVKISGAVTYPNTVGYHKGARLKYYIGQGGGYAARAARRSTHVVHMNGMVARARFFSRPRVTPGSEIIVLYKPESPGRISATEIISMATSVTSMGAIVTSLLNNNK